MSLKFLLLLSLLLFGCTQPAQQLAELPSQPAPLQPTDSNISAPSQPKPAVTLPAPLPEDANFTKLREELVQETIYKRGVKSPAVLQAMRSVQRHFFVPDAYMEQAYEDHPLPIGSGQTISQPYIVAFMTETLQLQPGQKVLEIGTGSGYQAAVLAHLTDYVYSIEIIESLAKFARQNLDRAGYAKVITKAGDGYQGWPEYAPFDAIIITAAVDHVPQPLLDQLKPGSRLILPLETDGHEVLTLFTKTPDGLKEEKLINVRFVPLTGEAVDQNREKTS